MEIYRDLLLEVVVVVVEVGVCELGDVLVDGVVDVVVVVHHN